MHFAIFILLLTVVHEISGPFEFKGSLHINKGNVYHLQATYKLVLIEQLHFPFFWNNKKYRSFNISIQRILQLAGIDIEAHV